MTDLVRSEALKLRSLRSTWIVTGLTVAVGALAGTLQVLAQPAGSAVPNLAEIALTPTQLLWLLVVVLAILASAGEFQHRTVRTTLLAAPRRIPVLVAKTVVAATTGALIVLGGSAVAVLAAAVAARGSGADLAVGGGADWVSAGAAVGVGAVWGVVATGLGILTRSTAAAITTVLLWRFVGEGVVPVVTRQPELSRWTPSGAANGLVGLGDRVLPVAGAAAVLCAYALAVCLAAGLLFVRADPA